MSPESLRVGLFTHSTNPRGAVVHALELGEALQAAGHRVTVHAPDATGAGFFRPARCDVVAIPARPCAGGLPDLVAQRIDEYLDHLLHTDLAQWDILHAQDSISANALATLVEQGRIHSFLRTVHHLDTFEDERLMRWQRRGYLAPSHVLCVSRTWQDNLRRLGVEALPVTNAVDTRRFAPVTDLTTAITDQRVRERHGVHGAPVYLVVGGVEERKNTLRIFEAFRLVQQHQPAAQLAIVGGASLLDHSGYRARFDAALQTSGLAVGPNASVTITGPIPHDDLPALYRSASALVFASVKEGFGLAVLEAMACEVPVVASQILPFTEYLQNGDCVWADPYNVASIAAAMLVAGERSSAQSLREAGRAVCARFTWSASAQQHREIYAQSLQPAAVVIPSPSEARERNLAVAQDADSSPNDRILHGSAH